MPTKPISVAHIQTCVNQGVESVAVLFAQAQIMDDAGHAKLALEFYAAIGTAAGRTGNHAILDHVSRKQEEISARINSP